MTSTRVRFILRYVAAGPKPAADVARFCALPQTTILDESERMLLVLSVPAIIDSAIASCPGWVVSADKSMPVPDARPKLKGGPT